jgi:hypothetical protein
MYYSTIFCWKFPYRDALEPLKNAHSMSLENGDIEFAMLNATSYCLAKLDLVPIPELVKNFREYRDIMRNYGQEMNVELTQPAMYILTSMSGRDDGDFAELRQHIMDMDACRRMKVSNIAVFEWSCYARMQVSYLFGNYEEAAKHSKNCQRLISKPLGCGDVAVAPLYDALVAIAMARKTRNEVTKLRLIRRASRRIRCLQSWSIHAPSNFLGKQYLLETELAALQGKPTAYPKYARALALSEGFHLQHALVLERTVKHFLFNKRDAQAAAPFLDRAIAGYRTWGGLAKADHLAAELNPASWK